MGILYSLLALIATANSPQCSCSKFSIGDQYIYADVIFTGTLKSIDTISLADNEINKSYPPKMRVATFNVDATYKGRFSKSLVQVITGMGGGDCGYDFDLNRKYIVYSREKVYSIVEKVNNKKSKKNLSRTFLETGICDRTTDEIKIEEQLLIEFMKTYRFTPPNKDSLGTR